MGRADAVRTLADDRELWERQPYETAVAFAAFVTYRDMGPSRSHARVGRKLGKSTTLMNRWSSQWSWVQRVEAYIEWEDREYLRWHQERLRRSKRNHRTLAQQLLKKLHQRIENLMPEDIPANRVDQILKTLTDVELTALGEASSISRLQLDTTEAESLEAKILAMAGVTTDAQGSDGDGPGDD